jgi:hypothetical protein
MSFTTNADHRIQLLPTRLIVPFHFMKAHLQSPRLLRNFAASAIVAVATLSSGHAVNIAISGVHTEGFNQPIATFFTTNFADVTVTLGDYSNPANIPAGTDILVIGRRLFSGAYGDATNSATFNGLTIPVIVMTSYVARPDGNRWGLHAGGAVGGGPVTGNETTVTAAGAAIFGVPAGAADWWSGSANFDATGATGSVGDGEILATLGGNILAAVWDAGDLTAGGATLGGDRLLFNIPEINGSGTAAFMPDTQSGIQSLANVITATTGLTQVPEPSGTILLLGSAGLLTLRRRRAA